MSSYTAGCTTYLAGRDERSELRLSAAAYASPDSAVRIVPWIFKLSMDVGVATRRLAKGDLVRANGKIARRHSMGLGLRALSSGERSEP